VISLRNGFAIIFNEDIWAWNV